VEEKRIAEQGNRDVNSTKRKGYVGRSPPIVSYGESRNVCRN